MYDRLEEGGTLAAITSQHWKFASEKKCIDFRNWLKEVHGEVFEISAGEFKESGTSISTMAVVIKKKFKIDIEMNIGLLAVDSNYPNLALMKISAWHKARGDNVGWYNPFNRYDKVYMAKVFSFTEDYLQYITNADCVEKGGTGYDIRKVLPMEIDRMQPDYSIYPQIDSKTAYGFLTRGCPNRCKWCVVPKKEGKITPYMDIEEIAVNGRKNIILMDNNVLASDYGLQQIEKIVSMGVRVDFNQGLDARLVTDDIAQLLARVKWMNCIRFGCDTPGQIAECERATALIDKYGYKGEYFFYCILMNDFKEAFNRVNHWRKRGRRFLPYAQPYRDLNNPHQIIPQWQKDLAGWVDKKWIFRSCEFKDFIPRKGFKCSEYFFNQL